MLPLLSGCASDAAVCTFSSRLTTTLHMQWHKEPKCDESALDPTSCRSPQRGYSTSTLLVFQFPLVKTHYQVATGSSICLCTGWRWKGCRVVRKRYGELKVQKKRDREEPWDSLPSPQFYSSSTAAVFPTSIPVLPKGLISKHQSNHQWFVMRGEEMIPDISR